MKEDQIRNLKILLQRLDIVRDKISAHNESKEKFNIFTCLMATLTQNDIPTDGYGNSEY